MTIRSLRANDSFPVVEQSSVGKFATEGIW
jgi:hypothetical protein